MNSLTLGLLGVLASTSFAYASQTTAASSAGPLLLTAAADIDTRTINIVSGTYGQNCGVARGNATRDLARRCDGHRTCGYVLSEPAGQSAAGCRRDFHAEWRCGNTEFHAAFLSAGAQPGDVLVLSCKRENAPGKGSSAAPTPDTLARSLSAHEKR